MSAPGRNFHETLANGFEIAGYEDLQTRKFHVTSCRSPLTVVRDADIPTLQPGLAVEQQVYLKKLVFDSLQETINYATVETEK